MDHITWNNQTIVGSSYEKAVKHGDKRYLSSEPCVNGHVGHRYTKNKTCIRCRSVRKNYQEKDSRMLEIDHLIEQKAEQVWMDKYYYLEF